MTDPVRIALVGCGRQMRQNLFPFLQRVRGHQIVACVDPDLSLAAEIQAQTYGAVCAESVEGLDLSTVDAAVIAVPPEPSSLLTRHLAERGVDCFVEKPAGPSTPALEELDHAVRRSGRNVQVGFNFRYAETLARLHELTTATRATPCSVTIDFYSRHPSAPQWGVDTTLEAWIRHNGVHALDLARWFVPSPVVQVDAHAISGGPDRFQVVVILRHLDGSLSTLRMGNNLKRFLVSVSVQGTDGSRYSAPSLERVTWDLDAGTPLGQELHSTRNLDHGWARSGFGPELAFFIESCRRSVRSLDGVAGDGVAGAEDGPGVGDALAASALCDRALEGLAAPAANGFGVVTHPMRASAQVG
ncbi:Gfo/Idh/MocA family protein [Sphaerisporangium viridialbum]|uniref:Gfo/Idh/MocA family protein n=1 Tax=Sphaerisporangium viridialbum TaxID=46189 RepID=UPI003C734DBF